MRGLASVGSKVLGSGLTAQRSTAARLLFIGDSISAMGTDWTTMLTAKYNHGYTKATNVAEGGARVVNLYGTIHDFETQVEDSKAIAADVIFVLLGTNDWSADSFLGSYVSNLITLKTYHPSAAIVCLGILPRFDSYTMRSTLNALIEQAADLVGTAYLNTDGWITRDDTVDDVHPNATGSMKVCDATLAALPVPLIPVLQFPVYGPTIVRNGDISLGNPPDSWIPGSSGVVTRVSDSHPVSSDVYAMDLAIATGQTAAVAFEAVNLTNGKPMILECFAKNVDAASVAIILYNSTWSILTSRSLTATSWTRFSAVVTPDDVSGYFSLMISGTPGQHAHFAGVSLRPLDGDFGPDLLSGEYTATDCTFTEVDGVLDVVNAEGHDTAWLLDTTADALELGATYRLFMETWMVSGAFDLITAYKYDYSKQWGPSINYSNPGWGNLLYQFVCDGAVRANVQLLCIGAPGGEFKMRNVSLRKVLDV